MREIEFRGKRKDNNEWVYGSLITRKRDGYKRTYIYDSSIDETEIDEYSEDSKQSLKSLFTEVIPESVGQYIGLLDKNERRLFEGMIVQFGEWHADDEEIGNGEVKEVERFEGTIHEIIYCADLDYPAFDLSPSVDRDCNAISHGIASGEEAIKVIGNIFDNPELLSKK